MNHNGETNYEIHSWDLGDEGFYLTVRLNGKRFIIDISRDNFHDSPSALMDFDKHFDTLLSGETEADGLWNYLDWIVASCLPRFKGLAPPVVHSGTLTLADLFNCEVFECRLDVINETPLVGFISLVVHEEEESVDLRSLESSFPLLYPSEVEVLYDSSETALSTIPRQVLVQGRHLFYKSSMSLDSSREEIKKYTRIAASRLSIEELRTPRLYGIVRNIKGRIHGLLYHWIEADQTLTWAVDADTPATLREKWASQIKNTLIKLHQMGVVWGDAKAENVLIHKKGDAIIIDLEGGTTRGWVEEGKGGTIDGDLQGLENIMDYIFNDESLLRPHLEPDDEISDRFEEE